MKQVRRIIIGVVVLLVLIVLSIPLWIDRAARRGVEVGSGFALGVPTTLAGADIGILAGQTELDGLNISNPPGFDSTHFLKLDKGRLAVSLGSLRTDTVEVPEFALEGIDVNLERRAGKANYQVIMDNLGRFESGEKAAQDSEPARKFVIREILIKNVKVNVDLLPVGGSLTKLNVPIDEIRLKNVGTGTDKGVLISQLTGVLLKAILMAVVEKGGSIIPADVLGELKSSLASLEPLQQVGAQLAVNIDGAVKQLTGQAGEAARQANQAVGEAAKNLTDQAKSVQEEAKRGLEKLLPPTQDKKR